MDAIDCIMTRRSIRQYENKPVPDKTIKTILEAAMMAPSGNDRRPWRFIVIKDKKALDEIANVYQYHRMAKDSAVAILVCGDPAGAFWEQDCSNATMNILLAAHALGLGAVWCGIHPRQDREGAYRKLFRIPENIMPFALIPIGMPAEKRAAASRYDEKLVHKERW
jgi:nitroreductase